MHRLPAFTPHRKGKVERVNLTIEQMLISQLPGFTGGPRDAAGRLYGPIKDSVAAQRAAESAAEGEGPLRLERSRLHARRRAPFRVGVWPGKGWTRWCCGL
jgi:putative transposase